MSIIKRGKKKATKSVKKVTEEEKVLVTEEVEEFDDGLGVQTTFNEDEIDELVEDGEVENVQD